MTKQVTIGNLGTDQALVLAGLLTANHSLLSYTLGAQPTSSATDTFPAVPTSQLVPGDLTLLQVIATTAAATSSRIAGTYFTDPTDQTVTLGPAITGASASVLATTPYARLGLAYTLQPQYTSAWFAEFSQGTASARSASVAISAAYAAGATALNLNMPDLSAASGWDNTWALAPGVSTSWTLGAFNWTGNGGVITAAPANGTTYLEASTMGTLTP